MTKSSLLSCFCSGKLDVLNRRNLPCVSLLENAGHIGLPIPEKLKDVLAQLHNREDKDNTTDPGE